MTAPDPRVGEIEARLSAANAELDRLTSGNPGANWRWSIPANPERDSDIILSASIADVPYLLAELRKAREALARVEGVATDLATRGAAIESKGYNGSINSNINEGRSIGYLEGARHIRAAVAAANGDEQ